MAVEALTAFPSTIVAGDTVRVDHSESDYPSDEWTLAVVVRGATSKSFTADASGDGYEIVMSAAETAKLTPGSYTVTFIYTETDSGERVSVPYGRVQVLTNPSTGAPKTVARKTLEAMEAALLLLSSGEAADMQSVNFNGQSYTKRNLKDLQDAIDRQRAIVAAEEEAGNITSGRGRYDGIGIRFGRVPYSEYC